MLDEIILQHGDPSVFVGYDTLKVDDAIVEMVVRSDGVWSADGLQTGEAGCVVLDKTPFYAEAGGQIGDRGHIHGAGGESWEFEVDDTRKIGGTYAHFGTCVHGPIKQSRSGAAIGFRAPGTPLPEARLSTWVRAIAKVGESNRRATMRNHTGTHVMNWALREVLGDHVHQKGSLVDHEKTRFDFSHPKPLTPDEVERVEKLVNDKIRQDVPVYFEEVPQEQALKINGLRAVFGERYPDVVRVMSVGVPVAELLKNPDNPAWRDVSIEFCGGTHVRSTGEIEHFIIATEEAVAKGIRRVVGLTGGTAQLVDECGAAMVARAEELRQGPPAEVPNGIAELQNTLSAAMVPLRHRVRIRQIAEELQHVARQQQKSSAADAAEVVKQKVTELLAHAEKKGETTIVVGELPDVPIEQLKTGADIVKQKCGSAAVLFGIRIVANEDEPAKAVLLAAMTPDLIKKGLKAGDLVKAIAPIVGGGGGGPPTMAQAGGKNPEKLAEALEAGRKWIAEKL